MYNSRLKWPALIAIGALFLGACSQNTNDTNPTTGPESISIMSPYFSATPPEDDDAINVALNQLTGTTINMRWVPDADYGSTVNTVLASNDIPQVMVIKNKDQGFIQTAQAGGFWDLTDYLASGDYPNLIPATPEIQDNAAVNGRVFGIFRLRDVMRESVIIRADWLKNLGLSLPKTTDDLKKIAQAFTENDPDGNGVNDTSGILMVTWAGVGNQQPLDAFDIWFGAGNVWKVDNGKLVPSWTTPEWQQSLKYARDMVTSGYVNPDWATAATSDWNSMFVNNKGGIIIDVSSRAAQLINLYRESDPDNFSNYVTLTGQLSGPNGTFAMPTAGYSGFLAISKSSVTTEDQLKQVLTVLDKLNTKDAQILLNNGIEGQNFTVTSDGFATYNTDADSKAMTDLVQNAWAQIGMNVGGNQFYVAALATDYDKDIYQTRQDIMANDAKNAVFNPALGLNSDTYTTNGTQLDQIISDARIQYIAGQLDDAGLAAAIQRWKDQGGDKMTDEYNTLYSSK